MTSTEAPTGLAALSGPAIDYYAGIEPPPVRDRLGAQCPDCKAATGEACTSRGKPWTRIHKGREWAVATLRDREHKAWHQQMRSAWLDRCHDEGVHPDVMNAALKEQWKWLSSSRLEIAQARDRWIARYEARAYRGKGKTAPPIPEVVIADIATWRTPYAAIGPTVQ